MLLWFSFNERRNDQAISFLINIIISFLNIWAHYSATCRFRFRLGENTSKAAILRLNLDPRLKLMEIFGNIPIISWVSAFLGVSSTVIDFHYQEGRGEVLEYRNKAMMMIRQGDLKGFKNFFHEERRKEMMGKTLQSDIQRSRIDPYNTVKLVGHTPWFYEDIKDRYKALNLNLMELKKCKSILENEKYDRFLIDPPYGFETGYQDVDTWKLVTNSLELVKMTSNSDSIGFFVVPPIRNENDATAEWREKLYQILDSYQIIYEKPGRRNRLVPFKIK